MLHETLPCDLNTCTTAPSRYSPLNLLSSPLLLFFASIFLLICSSISLESSVSWLYQRTVAIPMTAVVTQKKIEVNAAGVHPLFHKSARVILWWMEGREGRTMTSGKGPMADHRNRLSSSDRLRYRWWVDPSIYSGQQLFGGRQCSLGIFQVLQ